MQTPYDPARNTVRSLDELVLWQQPDKEPVLEPDLPIIDPHHHLWARPTGDYLPGQALADMESGHNVIATVFIECGSGHFTEGPVALRPVGETALVAQAVSQHPSGIDLCAGIVGRADLRLGENVRPVLSAHIDAAQGRFRGIRQILRWDEAGIGMFGKPGQRSLALDPHFRAGFTCLQEFELSFDAWLYHTQLDELVDLAMAFPGVTIILNHLGGPLGVGPYQGRRDQVFADWRTKMAKLSRCPNVVVKLGGLGMLYFGFDFYKHPSPPGSPQLAQAWSPYIAECLTLFGADRCMLESNFPIDKQTCSYRTLWNAFKILTADLSISEKTALYSATAARVYRLSPHRGAV